jgi:hypothetical protein
MKLINKTIIPIAILEPLIDEAVKFNKPNHTNFSIKFTAGCQIRGMAYRNGQEDIATEGWIDRPNCRIVVPFSANNKLHAYYQHRTNAYIATWIYRIVVHEINHVTDYQAGEFMKYRNQRRINRPCEIRAKNAEDEAMKIIPTNLLDPLLTWINENRR